MTLSNWKTKRKENGCKACGGGDDLKDKQDKIAELGRLGQANQIDWSPGRSTGSRLRPSGLGKGEACQRRESGKRGKVGTKRRLVVGRRGTRLTFCPTGANAHDTTVFEELIDRILPVRQPRGRPRKHPLRLHADIAYALKMLCC